MRRALFAAALFVVARATALDAQVVDTTRADSLARDTTDYTALFLKSQQESRRLIPAAPRIGAAALLPSRARVVVDRDSVLWHGAETVSDLLTRVPGVFLLRGGWTGRPELPTYQARGAASVEYLLDGFPYLPLGQDSVMVDPSLLPLSFLDRVEIERLPGQLRVSLFTHRHDRSTPYSRIGIASGDLQFARYQGQLEKRSSKGPGFALAFDHLSVPVQKGDSGSYSNTQGLIRLDYVRTSRFGAELQFLQNSPHRQPIFSAAATRDVLSRALHGSRRDLSARVFFAPGKDGLGPRVDVLAGRSSFSDELVKDSTRVIKDSLDALGHVIRRDTTYDIRNHVRGVTQAGIVAAYRLPAASGEISLFWRSTWTPLDLRARGGFAPNRWLTTSLEGVYLSHDGSRSSQWLTARAGLLLPWGFAASAVWRRGSEVSLPAILLDPAQHLEDRSLTVSWRASFAELEATYTSNAGFHPAGYLQYPALSSVAPSGRTDWLALGVRLAPKQWLNFGGWYSSPRGMRPEGQPPTHSLINATIQSKFLPTFRSGIFNLKLQVSAESWGTGVLGRDKSGSAVTLPGTTYFRGFLGLQIGSFTAYYDRSNMQGSFGAFVPNLPVRRFATTFGVRWEFAN